ncbi:MAG: alanine racemase [Chloroflexota bacterium]|nr:alanine racemase [Chloroflexota bacterium]
MQSALTRAWVEIDLGALRRNGATLAARSGKPLLPMIKADAYGLGAVAAARALEALEPWGFGVATIEEGVTLREAGIERPLVVFTPLARDDLRSARAARLTPALARAGDIANWVREGGRAWHLAIDTGMSRAGIRWDLVDTLREAAAAAPPEGAFTHFHSAERNDGSVAEQERRFDEAIARLGWRPPLLHVENSAALARQDHSRWDLIRPGIFLYGVGSGPGARVRPEPVVQLRARVVDLRTIHDGETVSYGGSYCAIGERRIATLGLGYADGYVRSLSNRGVALLRGRRVPIAGVVTMDMTMLDVTDGECEIGDVATLIGRSDTAELDLETVARTADMSPYELLTGLRGRLAHIYRDSPV